MKNSVFIFILFYSTILSAQNAEIDAQIYKWQEIVPENDTPISQNILFQGSTRDLREINVSGYQMNVGTKQNQSDFSDGQEHLVIVKEGILNISIMGKHKALGPGSIAMIMPDDQFSLSNKHDKEVHYYVLSYYSKAHVDHNRGANAGGSFMIDWNDLTFNEHDKGGIRQYFNRPTAMCKYYEMHVTTLNAGLKSHEPHTHRAAEIVLMIEGETEMLIGNDYYQGTKGDIYFLPSNVPHAIQNIGSRPAMYFAFQWK